MDQLTRREFIKKIVLYGGIASFGGQFFISDLSLAKALEHLGSIEPADYYRIVVLGDPHLPVREREVKDVFKQEKIIAAKNQVVNDINSWDDVNQIHVVGDVVAQFGNRGEYEDTKQYFAQFNKPLSFTTGNHDYIYEDCFSPEGKFLLASSESSQKLNCFIETFGLTKLYFSQSSPNLIYLYFCHLTHLNLLT